MAPLDELAMIQSMSDRDLPRVTTAKLLAQIGYEHAKGPQHQIMVFGELLHQRQGRLDPVDTVYRTLSHDEVVV